MELKTFKIGKHANVLAVSPDGCLIARCVPDYSNNYPKTNVYVFDCKEQKEIYNVKQSYMISALAFSYDSKLLAVGSTDGIVSIHDITKKELISDYRHKNAVDSVNFSKDSAQIVSGSEDGTAIVWNIQTHEQVQIFGRGGEWVHDAKFVNENDVAIVHDSCLEIWNIHRKTLCAALRYEHKDDPDDYFTNMPSGIVYNEVTHQIAVKIDKTLQIYETKDLYHVSTVIADAHIQSFEFSRDGSLLVYATKNAIVVRDAKTLKMLENHYHPFEDAKYNSAVGFCADGMQIYVKATNDTEIHFFYSLKLEQNIISFLLASQAKEDNPVKRFVNLPSFDKNLLYCICEYL